MSSKWYPELVEIIEDSLIVYDTCSLLNVYRYSLVNSKRILEYFKKYEDNIWLPYQVKKEFNTNKHKVKSPNLYKNLDKSLITLVNNKHEELLVELSVYEKRGFSKFPELQDQLKSKFEEMNDIIKHFKQDIMDEIGVYKEFIEAADEYLDNLLGSDKVSEEISSVDLLEIIKEGELRYKYKIPPGYEDEGKEKGINKFGDLIIWKEIINKAINSDVVNIIFVTNDTKKDWFLKNSQNVIEEPRKELISEFKHYNNGKNVIIIPFQDFIEEVSDPSDPSRRELLLELRMSNLIKRLPFDAFMQLAENEIQSIDINDVVKKLIHSTSDADKIYINNIIEISTPTVENVILNPNGISIKESEIIYYINAVAECDFSTISSNSSILSYGSIHSDIVLNIELKRKLTEDEKTFIDKFKDNYSDFITIAHYTAETAKYIWGNDDDYDPNISIETYTTCPSCYCNISNINDAGDGFCINCSES
ncbi:PIN-like domain-containing protein [Gracilibacillus alcaliphilus]|uniref:PIN-like domain-containing protein n=1 Tax=Gracilibacillus alcaliphilus TaxID=1401441 RepID=UPI001956C193|nr:PIN-like domain-containing protein [Gracilibacillus alcaliphilus]MBM7679602.1 hypothetical protein [Gracilibacillus alcaliphilus]